MVKFKHIAAGLLCLALSACGGGGDGGGGGEPPPMVTISGRITFDRVPFSTTGAGLDYSQTEEQPARRVVVEVLRTSGAVIDTTSTDDQGSYTLEAPAGTDVFVRAKAQTIVSGSATAPASWRVAIRNNTNGDALYVLDSSVFNVATIPRTLNLRAASGWGGTSYTSTRAAAPFAVLDTMYSAIRFVVEQGGYGGEFPALDVFWSVQNRDSDNFVPSSGLIVTTSYKPGLGSIYVLGSTDLGATSDTDEFDQHVLAHEFHHYLEEALSRSDSVGGEHSLSDRLDLRVAFSEGFSNAFSAMVLGDPDYRDSFGVWPSDDQIRFDLEWNPPPTHVRGWFNEWSVQSIVWDLYDTADDNDEPVAIHYDQILDVFRDELRSQVPLTSIFAFVTALKQRSGVDDALVNDIVRREEILASGMTAYADGEDNDGGIPEVLPVYEELTLNGSPVTVCVTRLAGTYNALGNRRHLRFSLPGTRQVNIFVTSQDAPVPVTPDPDLYLWQAGLLAVSECGGPNPVQGCTEQQNSERYIDTLPAGDYVLEVFEYSHVDLDPNADRRGPTCMFVSITG